MSKGSHDKILKIRKRDAKPHLYDGLQQGLRERGV